MHDISIRDDPVFENNPFLRSQLTVLRAKVTTDLVVGTADPTYLQTAMLTPSKETVARVDFLSSTL